VRLFDADGFAEGGSDFEIEDEVGDGVHVGGVAIEYDEFRAVLFCDAWETGGWKNDEGGADGDEEIGGEGFFLCAAHGFFGHGLAEGDGGSLDDAFAVIADGEAFVFLEGGEDGSEGIAASAVEAFSVGGVAVEFDDLIVGDAGVLVEVVDVLGDDGFGFSFGDEFGDGAVSSVWLDGLEGFVEA